MVYCLLLRLDPTGPCPVLLRDDEQVTGDGDGVRYRFIAQTESWEEADAIMAELHQRIAAREL